MYCCITFFYRFPITSKSIINNTRIAPSKLKNYVAYISVGKLTKTKTKRKRVKISPFLKNETKRKRRGLFLEKRKKTSFYSFSNNF